MTIKSTKDLQYLSKVPEFPSFLGLCNAYRHFAPNFAKLASPLNKKLKKRDPLQFSLDEGEMKAVDVLSKMLVTSPVLALSKSNSRYNSDTDACDFRVRCI